MSEVQSELISQGAEGVSGASRGPSSDCDESQNRMHTAHLPHRVPGQTRGNEGEVEKGIQVRREL